LIWALGELLKKGKTEERHTQKRYIPPIKGEAHNQPIFTNFCTGDYWSNMSTRLSFALVD
jgi:hypothetical protein